MSAPTFIDLFSGCGGFTLGMQRAGFHCLATVDFNTQAVATLRTNLQSQSPTNLPPVGFALKADLTNLAPERLAAIIGTDSVDVIVGGPPCQGFSTARQRDGSNHGKRLKEDSRRHLFRDFLRHVEFFQPRIFVIENVLGLRSAAGGQYFTAVQSESRVLGKRDGRPGYRVHGQIENAEQLGVPQKRRRQLIIGVRADLAGYFSGDLLRANRATSSTLLGDAICDLPPLAAGKGENKRDYDFRRRREFLSSKRQAVRRRYLFEVLEATRAEKLTGHVARPHSDRDMRDFAKLREGENAAVAFRERGVEFEFPYDRASFKDRYTRQSRFATCSTIVAHLAKDGLMFIHPTQNRSLTPREAARVQSFPDWFRFPEARTHSFRMIGNAVPPLVAEAVGQTIAAFFRANWSSRQNSRGRVPAGSANVVAEARNGAGGNPVTDDGMPRGDDCSGSARARELERIARLDRRLLRALPKEEFLHGWHALLFLFPNLDPKNALDHGWDIEVWEHGQIALPGFDDFASQRYARSGWPVSLTLIGEEAWRRYGTGELQEAELYCAGSQIAGILSRTPHADAAPLRGRRAQENTA